VSLSKEGARFVPDEAKVTKWVAEINRALSSGRLCGGEASKLSGKFSCCVQPYLACLHSRVRTGRLSWACQFTFRRLGRAMLYPIFKQRHARSSLVGDELRLALRWWVEALAQNMSELRPWDTRCNQKPLHLLVDARSTPPRVAAVLIQGGVLYYSDAQPSNELMQIFTKRDDNQIMSLEILSIAFGLSVFKDQLRGQNVHVHSDNTAAQHNTAKGRAKTFDHTCLVHGIWTMALELQIGLYVSRVPTKENIADDPSRERYSLLKKLGAVWKEPALHERFRDPSTWEALRPR